MTDNLDFSKTIGTINPSAASTKLTVYGPQGTIPLNPVRFPNVYLTAPSYDLSNNIVGANGPKLNIYRSIPETKYPFTYIGTPNINNYGYFGYVNPSNAPKISVYQQASDGTLEYSFNYNNTPNSLFISSNIPLITGTALNIVKFNFVPVISAQSANWTITVTVNISYIDNGSDFGLSFKGKSAFINNGNVSNLQITILNNIPLSRNGYQFASIKNASSLFASNTLIPTILPNTSLAYCFYKVNTFNSDISLWDTKNVTDMSYMFSGGWYSNGVDTQNDVLMSFNQDIGNLNTSNVTTMTYMFACTKYNAVFNKNLSNWNTSNVTNMSVMFAGCTVFNNSNNPLTTNGNKWDTSNVTLMYTMFCLCFNFNQNIGSWNTSSVIDITDIFNSCTAFDNGGQRMLWTFRNIPTYARWHNSCLLTKANAPTQLQVNPYW